VELSAFPLFFRDGLAEADWRLSATRFSGTAAAILKTRELFPIVAEQQKYFLTPWLWPLQVGKKSSRTGTGFLFLTHALYAPLGRPVD
jgi:hypothetical protein